MPCSQGRVTKPCHLFHTRARFGFVARSGVRRFGPVLSPGKGYRTVTAARLPCAAERVLRARLDDRDAAALAARPERDGAGADREDRVVAADLGAGARAEPRAPLADDDVARLDGLAVEDLHPEVLRVRVATVLRGAEPLLVCHLALLLRLQRGIQRGDRALACGVRLLVLEGRLQHRAIPGLRTLGDLRDGHLLIPVRHSLD